VAGLKKGALSLIRARVARVKPGTTKALSKITDASWASLRASGDRPLEGVLMTAQQIMPSGTAYRFKIRRKVRQAPGSFRDPPSKGQTSLLL